MDTKRIVFTAVMLGIPFLLFVILEFVLRIGGYGEDLRLFVPTPDTSSEDYGINLRVGQRYVYYLGDHFEPIPIKDLFLRKKPENGVRIFVLGASSAAGFPYSDNVSFPRFLHRRLIRAFPDRHIEVINTAITSVNTYTLLDFMDEILAQEPDVLLLYSGHNEYYAPFGPASIATLGSHRRAVKAILFLQRFRTFVLMRKVMISTLRHGASRLNFSGEPVRSELPTDSTFIARTNVPYGGRMYHQGLDQFEKNIEEIVRKAREAGVSIVLSELISNVRDQAPFASVDGDSFPSAASLFQKARRLEADGRYEKARDAYTRAKDLDPIRFRAPEAFNDILHRVAESMAVPIVPMKSYFEDASPRGLIGDTRLLDHIHPDYEGYSLMAEAFYNTLRRERLIWSQWPEEAGQSFARDREGWGYTPLDSVHASLVILNLKSGWPFRMESFSSITGQGAIERFHPVTRTDSIALKVLLNPNYNLLTGHLDLARMYESDGNYDKAFSEYKSVIYSIPSVDLSYRDAVAFLVRIREYERLHALLNEARRYNPSAFILKWLGYADLMLGRMRDGIVVLKQASERDPADLQILVHLSRACYQILEFKRGDAFLAACETRTPKDPAIASLRRFRDSMLRKAQQIDVRNRKARSDLEAGRPGEAVRELRISLETHETAQAREMMGILMMGTGRYPAAVSHFERAQQLSLEESPESLYYRTLAYIRNGQPGDARRTLGNLIKADPLSPHVKTLESMIREEGAGVPPEWAADP